VVRLPRKPKVEIKRRDSGKRKAEPDLIRILSGSEVPISAALIVERLAAKGDRRSMIGVYMALERRPELFVKVRKRGFMLRSEWEKHPLRYFLTTNEIVQMAREVMVNHGKPVCLQFILGKFHEAGRRLCGNELISLSQVLQRADHFEAKGRRNARWSLRSLSEGGLMAA
jgi:hypothetical protein